MERVEKRQEHDLPSRRSIRAGGIDIPRWSFDGGSMYPRATLPRQTYSMVLRRWDEQEPLFTVSGK